MENGGVNVRIGGVELFVEVLDQPQAESLRSGPRPVLLGLHGGPGFDGAKLRYELKPLTDLATVMVPDQRGHGRSDLCGPESWNLATWAGDVKSLADVLGVAHPVVLGTSFGGFVAQKYAATFPDHPSALILMGTIPRWPPVEESVERFRQLGGEEAADAIRRDREAPSQDAEDAWWRVCEPLMTLRRDRWAELDWLWVSQLRTLDVARHFVAEGEAMDLRPGLTAVQCPTLVLVGEHDPLVPVELAQEIIHAIPDALGRLEVISGAAHNVLIDNPEQTYALVREFLVDVRAA